MPVTTTDYIPYRIVYSRFDGAIEDEQYLAEDYRTWEFLDRPEVVEEHLLIDIRTISNLPNIKTMSKSKCGRHPKIGWVIVLGFPNPAYKFFIVAVTGILRLRVRFFDTFEQATTFIQQVDATLPNPHLREYRENISYGIPLTTPPIVVEA